MSSSMAECGGIVGLDIFAERRFLNFWSKWPLEVLTLLRRCLEIKNKVSPGKVVG